MQTIHNPQNVSLEEMLPRLQERYPGAVIKKPWIGPPMIHAPVDNYKLIVRPQRRRQRLIADFVPPVLWSVLGMLGFAFLVSFLFSMFLGGPVVVFGGMLVAVGFLIVKGIFGGHIKEQRQRWKEDLERSMSSEEGRVF